MTKTISLSDEAYEELRLVRRKGESFSDVTRRLARAERQRQVLDFAGAWKDDPDAEALEQEVRRWREETRRPPPVVE